jgi:hypothetical protein
MDTMATLAPSAMAAFADQRRFTGQMLEYGGWLRYRVRLAGYSSPPQSVTITCPMLMPVEHMAPPQSAALRQAVCSMTHA